MALCHNVVKSQRLLHQYFVVMSSNRLLKCLVRNQGSKSIDLDSDTLDVFTTQLMQRKSNKWEIMKTRRKLNSQQTEIEYQPQPSENKVPTEYLNTHQLDILLRDAVEAQNADSIKEIVNQYIECKRLPTLTVLSQTLSFYSQRGDKDTILTIINLSREIGLKLLQENSYFAHYLAEATWVKGNINEAIILFEDVYRKNTYLRRRIRFMLKFLMFDAITNRSEAALVNIISFAERLVDDFKDFYPLACVWQVCFLKTGLLKVVSSQMPFVVAAALKSNQTEVVYRLLELLLKYEDTSQYARILEALFDYQVHQGNLRGCLEIIRWSVEQEIELPTVQEEKLVRLLVSHSSSTVNIPETDIKRKPTSSPSYQFKF